MIYRNGVTPLLLGDLHRQHLAEFSRAHPFQGADLLTFINSRLASVCADLTAYPATTGDCLLFDLAYSKAKRH
jgi:hypothetical protein